MSNETKIKMSESAKLRCKKEGTKKTDLMMKAWKGSHHTKATKQKLRLIHLGKPKRKRTKKEIEFLRKIHIDKKVSKESIRKMLKTKKKNGTWYWSEETKKKLSEQRKGISYEQKYGKRKAKIIREKISETTKGKSFIERYGRKKAKSMSEKLSIALKGKKYPKGRHLSEEHKKKIGEANKGRKLSKEQIEGMKIRMKQLWASFTEEQRNEQVKRILTAQYPFPTSLEQYCINIFKEHNIPLDYTGNGLLNGKKFAIAGCYPDFVNLKKKIVVEVYACFHKRKQHGSVEAYQEKRLKRMNGWNVYFFEDNEVFAKEFISQIKNIFKRKIIKVI